MKKLFAFFLLTLCLSVHSQVVMADGVQGLTYYTYQGTSGPSPSISPLVYPTVRSTGISASINYPAGSFGSTVLGSGLADRVIVKWEGYINIPTAGTYYFGANADDGFKILVDNTVVTDSWIDSGGAFRSGAGVPLTAGAHALTFWYYENGGGQMVIFQYSTNNTNWAVVPTTMLATSANYWTPPEPVTATPVYSNYAISNSQLIKRTSGLSSNSGGHNAQVEITGDDNLVSVQQIGASGHYVSVSVNGSVNNVDVLQTSLSSGRHYLETTVVGSNNTVTLQQRETNKTQFVSVNGNYNTVTTNQKGSGNHFLEVSVTGNNHTAGVVQDGSGNHNARVILDGSQPWNFQLNQNSSTSQNYNLPHTMSNGNAVSGSCYTVGGCTLTINQQ